MALELARHLLPAIDGRDQRGALTRPHHGCLVLRCRLAAALGTATRRRAAMR
jgi:hypothetical protein